jgi:hypothetical protein
MFERAIAIRDDGPQTVTIFGGRKDTDGLSHTHRIAHLPTSVNLEGYVRSLGRGLGVANGDLT